jgi:hypothetical protein
MRLRCLLNSGCVVARGVRAPPGCFMWGVAVVASFTFQLVPVPLVSIREHVRLL